MNILMISNIDSDEKLEDDSLLLTEIEDISRYLDLDQVDKETREKFITDYKIMVYEYIKALKK